MNKIQATIAILILGLAACTFDSPVSNLPISTPPASALASDLATSQVTSTPTKTPPNTPRPSPTIRPTSWPSPTPVMGAGQLSESGPWYFTTLRGELWILDPSTLGWRRFHEVLKVQPAPTGGRLAITRYEDVGHYIQLADRLEVLELPSMALSLVMEFEAVELDSAEYPLDNFRRNNDSRGVLLESKNWSWSADGNQLIFAGIFGKNDSDLYLFDLQTNSLRQLSAGNTFAVLPYWLPTGEAILYAGVSSINFETSGSGYSDWVYWTVDLLTGTNTPLFTGIEYGWEHLIGWLGPDMALFDTELWWCGRYGLRSVNLASGESDYLWTHSYDEIVYDSSQQTALIISSPNPNDVIGDSCPGRGNSGAYLYDLNSQEVTKVTWDAPIISPHFDDSIGAFVVYSEGDYYWIYADGQMEIHQELGDFQHPAIYSPDGTSFAVVNLDSLLVYHTRSQRQLSYALPYYASGEVVWLPDASGMLVFQHYGKRGRVCFLELSLGKCREFPNLLVIRPRNDNYGTTNSDGWILP